MSARSSAVNLTWFINRALQFLAIDLILMPLLSLACDPLFFRDPVIGDCVSCDDICQPKYDTLNQCKNTPECSGVLENALKSFYAQTKVTNQPADAVTVTPCPTEGAPQQVLVDMQLTIGLAVALSAVLMFITTMVGCCLGRWWEKRRQSMTTKGPVTQEVGPTLPDHDRLLPSGGTSASTSTTGSSFTLDLQAETLRDLR